VANVSRSGSLPIVEAGDGAKINFLLSSLWERWNWTDQASRRVIAQ
jgi:hypothetical protein